MASRFARFRWALVAAGLTISACQSSDNSPASDSVNGPTESSTTGALPSTELEVAYDTVVAGLDDAEACLTALAAAGGCDSVEASRLVSVLPAIESLERLLADHGAAGRAEVDDLRRLISEFDRIGCQRAPDGDGCIALYALLGPAAARVVDGRGAISS